jgi:hypothetical protein
MRNYFPHLSVIRGGRSSAGSGRGHRHATEGPRRNWDVAIPRDRNASTSPRKQPVGHPPGFGGDSTKAQGHRSNVQAESDSVAAGTAAPGNRLVGRVRSEEALIRLGWRGTHSRDVARLAPGARPADRSRSARREFFDPQPADPSDEDKAPPANPMAQLGIIGSGTPGQGHSGNGCPRSSLATAANGRAGQPAPARDDCRSPLSGWLPARRH